MSWRSCYPMLVSYLMTSWKPSACVPCMAANWASPRSKSPRFSVSPAKPSAAGGPPTPTAACPPSPAAHRTTTGLGPPPLRRPGRTPPATAAHPSARRVGHRGAAVDPPRRRDLIRQEFDIDLAERTVGWYLKRWGFTAKRPRRHARDQDPEEVRQWLEETYPAIEARADREGAEIHWGDEVGVAADQQPARGARPRGTGDVWPAAQSAASTKALRSPRRSAAPRVSKVCCRRP